MKSFRFLSTLVAFFFSVTAFAGSGTPQQVLEAFRTTFATAHDANWQQTKDVYRVRFVMDGQHITAFYQADGTLAGLTRNISTQQLPVVLQTAYKNEYRNYWVVELVEFTANNAVEYYMALENGEQRIVLQSNGIDWSLYQKSKKS